jgi:RNA-directed DNA polymerase
MDRSILRKWLKSGYMEKYVFHETVDGTPQGGIISPALANFALDGLEHLLRERFPKVTRNKAGEGQPCVNFIRYADGTPVQKSNSWGASPLVPMVRSGI